MRSKQWHWKLCRLNFTLRKIFRFTAELNTSPEKTNRCLFSMLSGNFRDCWEYDGEKIKIHKKGGHIRKKELTEDRYWSKRKFLIQRFSISGLQVWFSSALTKTMGTKLLLLVFFLLCCYINLHVDPWLILQHVRQRTGTRGEPSRGQDNSKGFHRESCSIHKKGIQNHAFQSTHKYTTQYIHYILFLKGSGLSRVNFS